MSNIQTNLIAEFAKNGFSSPVFTFADLETLVEKNGVWVINGQEYHPGYAKSNIANLSIGPGNRIGAGVKRGLSPLFIKHTGDAVYSIYGRSESSATKYVFEQQFQPIPVAKKRNKRESLSMDLSEKPFDLTLLASDHSELFATNLLSANCESWAGGNILEFAKYVSGKGITIDLSGYPNIKLDRKNLFGLVSETTNSTFKCCIAILAWGGMNREHAASAFSSWGDWEPIASKIRSGDLTRSEAYNAFYQLRKSKKLKGLGPAYFTKIIYFLSKEENRGYIMDQWTARSVNLLLNTKAIGLIKSTAKSQKVSYFVTDKNTDRTYENFCLFIEHMAQVHQTTPDLIEMSLFSIGKRKGKERGKWRNYVISHDSYLYS